MKKTVLIVLVALITAAYAASFLPLDFLQPSLAHAMELALRRRVEIRSAHLTFLNGPGVALDEVTVEEDPRAGIEPFAYADTVQARLDLLALLRGRVAVSSLRFDDASLNLVKPDNLPWNFQMLLESPTGAQPKRANSAESVPSIKMRSGRVNIKYGQTKSVLFFDDVDMDISPVTGGLDLRFSGVPARTDRPVRNLEHFFIRGTYQPSAPVEQLRLTAQLEPSPMDAIARLFVANIFPLNGSLTANAEITGTPAQLDVTGEARLDTGAKWSYRGMLSLPDQQLQLQSAVESGTGNAKPAPAPIRIHVWDLLKVPHWEIQLEQAPLETFVGIARRLGAPVPDPFTAQGQANGAIAYRGAEGIEGKFDLSDVVLGVPVAAARSANRPQPAVAAEVFAPVRVPQAALSIQHSVASFGPAAVALPSAGGVEVSGRYNLANWNGAQLRITSKSLELGGLNPHLLAGLPLLSRVSSGIWRGALVFDTPGWSGNFDLQNARMRLDGFAEPLNVLSATAVMNGGSLDVIRLRARLGKIPFTGEYHFAERPGDGLPAQPQTFRIQAGEVAAEELERLFAPALTRAGGFLSRTLGLGSPEPAPLWLAKRQVAGAVSLQMIDVYGNRVRLDGARVLWSGATLRVSAGSTNVASNGSAPASSVALSVAGPSPSSAPVTNASRATFNGTPLSGELRVDLSGAAPQYHFAGRIQGFPYQGGRIDADGELDAAGTGSNLLATMKAQGTFRGQAISFAPDADFREASGRFAFRFSGTESMPLLTLSNLEAMQGNHVYVGSGSSQAGATLVLELTEGERTVHYSAPLRTTPLPPKPAPGTRPESERPGQYGSPSSSAGTASTK